MARNGSGGIRFNILPNLKTKVSTGLFTRVPNFYELYGANAGYLGNNEFPE